MKKLLFIITLLLTLYGCSAPKFELPVSEIVIETFEELPLYIYTTEEEFLKMKDIEAIDLTHRKQESGRFPNITNYDITVYAIVEGEYIETDFYEFDYQFTVPLRDGDYVIKFERQDVTLATHITIGSGKYILSEKLDIFEYSSGVVMLGNDNYEREYDVYSYDNLFDRMIITKDKVDGNYFNDFIYRVYEDSNDKSNFDELQLMNGNEIHYHNEVYYIHSIDTFDPNGYEYKLLTSEPMKLSDIINVDEIKDIHLINYIYTSSGYNYTPQMIELTNVEKEALLHELTSANYYDFVINRGTGGAKHCIELVTDNETYTLEDTTDPLYIYGKSTNSKIGEFTVDFEIMNLIEELDISILEPSKFSLANISPIPLYNYYTQRQYNDILATSPFDLTNSRGKSTELMPLDGSYSMTMYELQNGEYVEIEKHEKLYDFRIPTKDGEYAIIFEDDYNSFAGHFIIGDEDYGESVYLPIFNSQARNTDEMILLSTDNYNYEYIANNFNDYFSSMLITKNDVGGNFFNDFDYRIYEDYYSDKTAYEVVQFRNGNQIHYNGEVYYVNKIYPNSTKSIDILSTSPIKLNEIIDGKEITDIRYIQYLNRGFNFEDGTSDEVIIELTDIQQEALLNELFSINFYDTEPLAMGVGGRSDIIEITTTDGVYTIEDLYTKIIKDKNSKTEQMFNANFLLSQVAKELGIIQ